VSFALSLIESVPGGNVGAALLWWVVLFVAAIVSAITFLRTLLRRERLTRWWLFAPVVGVVAIALIGANLPLHARFEASRSAFEDLPRRDLPSSDSFEAGLYEGHSFERTDFGYRFVVSVDVVSEWGFAYSPRGRPAGPEIGSPGMGSGQSAYRQISTDWYIWEFRYT
jgi:hypothetical protein